jgi:6-phosphogluconolactonase
MTKRIALVSLLASGACASARPAAVPTAAAAAPASPADAPAFVYVGGYRPEISVFRLDRASGKLTPAGSAAAGTAPSFLAFDPSARHLYAVDEVDEGRVLAFAIDAGSGALTPLGTASSAGTIPAHLSVDRTGRWLLVANYADKKPGTIAVLPVDADGRLGAAADTRDFGPGTMPHMIVTDPGNRFVLVPCKGGSFVAQLDFDAATGKLTPNQPDRVPAPPGSGPRHLAFHPNGRLAYVINEQALTITGYAFDAATGRLAARQTVSTLPAGVRPGRGDSTAEIHVHPSGRFLYGSNRGYDSVAIYRLDDSGGLTLVGQERRTIRKPRAFDLDPSGAFLLVANQSGDDVSVFRVAPSSGMLEPVGPPTPAGKAPSFVGVVLLR